MNWVDPLILSVLVISALTAFFHGLIVEVFSLLGLVAGLLVASTRYSSLAAHMPQWLAGVADGQAANLSAFLAIALAIMLAAALAGHLFRGTIRFAGLGVFDRILGAAFGLVKGFVLVTLVVMAIMVFVPDMVWPANSRLTPIFVAAAHEGSHITGTDFGVRIREGIQSFRARAPLPFSGIR